MVILELGNEEFSQRFPSGSYTLIPLEAFFSFFAGDGRAFAVRRAKRAVELIGEKMEGGDYYALYHKASKIRFMGIVAKGKESAIYWFPQLPKG